MNKLNKILPQIIIIVFISLSAVSAAAQFKDRTLIRGKDKKIWLVTNGQKTHIKSLAELRRFSGRAILNVSDDELNKLAMATPKNSVDAVRQSTVTGTVISVSGSQFIMKTDDKTITVTLDPKGLMYIKKRGGRVVQSNLKPGHQVRVVTNDKIGSSVIKPLVIENFSLPLP